MAMIAPDIAPTICRISSEDIDNPFVKLLMLL